jgi:ubiquinone/menaquinone biosynthesis C-methylase UbiE
VTATPTSTAGRISEVAQAFDALSPQYDSAWTESAVGQMQRGQVWRELRPIFSPGERILELGCGTGVDAVFLARLGVRVHATDISQQMLHAAQNRVEREGFAGLVTFEICALEDVGGIAQSEPFDGVFSDFGAVNCLQDLASVAPALAGLMRPDGKLVLCFMGRFCLLETAFYLLHSDPRRAFRRFRAGREGFETSLASGPSFRVYYPSIAQLSAALGDVFKLVSFRSIGILVPPSCLERWAGFRRRTLRALSFLDEHIGGWPLVRGTGDHRLVVFVRR